MKKTILFFALCMTAFSLVAQDCPALQRLKQPKSKAYIFVAAHRGDWVYFPENTMPCLQSAIRLGVDIMETDVRFTKDEVLVMMHDPYIDRTTNQRGKLADFTLAEIKKFHCRNAVGTRWEDTKVATMEEFCREAKGKILLYYDKAGEDEGKVEGYKVKKILEVAKRCGTLQESVFVLDWTVEKAKRIFGDDLKKVLYCPVIEDKIPNLTAYVDEWLDEKPTAFQFRFKTTDSPTYKLLEKVNHSSSRAFVAATWKTHTADHDDLNSIFNAPFGNGWNWLIDNGFSIIETNYPRDILKFLDDMGLHDNEKTTK